MSLTTTFLSNMRSKENYDKDNEKQNLVAFIAAYGTFFILLVILDILLIIYAISCLINCQKNGNIPTWLVVLLVILLFTPVTGFFVSVGSIIYYHMSCKGSKQSSPSKFR